MKTLSFFVEGEPRAKQSFRSLGRRGGYTPARVKAWQSEVAYFALGAMRRLGLWTDNGPELLEANLTVELTFFLSNNRRIDLDNLSKAIQDGMNKITWLDDHQNIDLILHKYICRERPGVLVVVKPNDRPLEVTLKQQEIMIATGQYGITLEPQFVTASSDTTNAAKEAVPA